MINHLVKARSLDSDLLGSLHSLKHVHGSFGERSGVSHALEMKVSLCGFVYIRKYRRNVTVFMF